MQSVAARGRELEIKLTVAKSDLPAVRSCRLVSGLEGRTRMLSSTYFDTRDLRLRASAITLRVRESGGSYVQTAKLQSDGAGLFDRDEWEWPVQGPKPEVELLQGTPAGKLIEGSELVRQFTTEVSRKTWLLRRRGTQIEMSLDEGVIAAGSRRHSITEVELELKQGKRRRLFDVAREIAAIVPVQLSVRSKADAGFGLAEGRAPVAKGSKVSILPDMQIREAFAAIVRSCLHHFRRNEDLVVGKRQPEALHQARVALRRLKTAFSVFAPVIDDAETNALKEDLKWITRAMGKARDLDVLIEKRGARLDKTELQALRRRQEAAYDEVVARLQSNRLRLLLINLIGWAESGAWRKRNRAKQGIAPFATRRLNRAWTKTIRHCQSLAHMSEPERHQFRMNIKRLRYATEFFEALHRDRRRSADRFDRALREVQDDLGELNDLVTARTLVSDRGPEATRSQSTRQFKCVTSEELRMLKIASRHFDRLRRIGPYWAVLAAEHRDQARSGVSETASRHKLQGSLV